jgi:hypothetical protein
MGSLFGVKKMKIIYSISFPDQIQRAARLEPRNRGFMEGVVQHALVLRAVAMFDHELEQPAGRERG